MKTSTIVWTIIGIIVIVGIVLVASHHSDESYAPTTTSSDAPMIPAGGDTSTTTTTTTTGGTSTVAPQGSVVLNTSTDTTLGAYLTAANGMTLYQYDKDTVGVSNCTGSCAGAWAPYTITSATAMPLLAQPGATGSVGTITRADGTMQVTYNGIPLYFWQGDSKAGDTTGQNVSGFTVVTP